VTSARQIAEGIRTSIPELYIVGEPPASVIAFGSSHPDVDIMEVGDIMGKRGWHLNGLMDPKAVHIACTVRMNCTLERGSPLSADDIFVLQRLTGQAVDQFLADLKDAVREAKISPSGKGTMVVLYGTYPWGFVWLKCGE
jgi:sphinganine-1-phosphate aldolase